MKIQIKKDEVFSILSQIQGILEKRSTLPIFANVLITAEDKGSIQIYASDSELSFSASFQGKILSPGSMVLDGKKLFEIVRELSAGLFELSLEKNQQIILKQNKSLFKVHGLNPEAFPAFPPFKKKRMQTLLVEDLLDVIDKTLYCVSLDESRYHLTGVFLEQVSGNYRFVATDGHRMSFVDVKGEKSEDLKNGIIIPRKGLHEVKKMLSRAKSGDRLKFCIEKPRLLVQFKDQSLNIRLIEGEYPNYKSLLPKNKGKEIVVSTEEFLSALKRASVLTSVRFKGVNFTFKDNLLSIYFSQQEAGEASEELACEYKGEEIKIRFNSKYILDVLNSIHEKKIKVSLSHSKAPGLIQPLSKNSYTCLVMPMKL